MSSSAPLWGTTRIARHVWRFGAVASTQAEAKRLIAAGQGDGALVVAATQSAGRGRMRRTWHSPPGNLYLSVVLRPELPLAGWGALTLVAALALVETLDGYGAAGAAIKWPNDVLVGGRKLAGILAEVEDDWLVVGIGMNLNGDLPDELPHATSVKAALGAEIEAEAFLQGYVKRLDALIVEAEHGAPFGSRWAARMETLGRQVRLANGAEPVEGLAETVRNDGALLVRRADGALTACYGGDVSAEAPAARDTLQMGGTT